MNLELKLFGIMRISVNGLMLDNKNSSPGFSFGLLESAHVEWDMQSFRFSFDYEMRLKTRKKKKKKKTFLIQRHTDSWETYGYEQNLSKHSLRKKTHALIVNPK